MRFGTVLESSRGTYATGWQRWCNFTRMMQTDEFMSIQPPGMVLPPHYSFQEAVVVAFMMELRMFDDLMPETIANYMVGARFFLENSNYDCSFWTRSKIIHSTQQGMLVTHRATVDKADSRSLPFPCEAVLFAIEKIYTDGSALSKMMIAAFCVAFLCLLRSCEYIFKPAKALPHHHLRGRDIVFDAVGANGSPLAFTSSTARFVQWDQVIGVAINIHSAKNDKEGVGNQFYFKKRRLDSVAAFDIVQVLFDCAVVTQARDLAPFFSYRDLWALSYEQMNDAVKDVLRRMGFSEEVIQRFTTHSLRIGGASALANRGVPDYMIQRLGRWKSLAFLDYLRMSVEGFARAMSVITDVTSLTISDVLKMCPGVAYYAQA
jgi:hypothetical protein